MINRRILAYLIATTVGVPVIACTESGFTGSAGRQAERTTEQQAKPKKSKDKLISKADADKVKEGESDTDTPASQTESSVDSGGRQDDSDSDTGKPADGSSQSDSASNKKPEASKAEQNPVTQRFSAASSSVKLPVDIVFAMDTSGSMDDEKNLLQTHMATFVAEFQKQASGLDFQIFFIGVDFTFPNTGTGLNLVPLEVSSHDALAVFMDFFRGGGGGKVVRSESIKQLVVVTDDEAEDSAATFKNFVNATPTLRGKTRFNGIIGLPTSKPNAQCTVESVGQQYISLASDPDLKGLIQDLCVQDWGSLLKSLANNIITQSKTNAAFRLDRAADISKPIIVEVNGSKIRPDVAAYNEQQQSIIFLPGKEPNAGAQVTVTYYPG